ncbi:hypothetical protein [Couchioplanes azureus]|uniref:hypothetical protein n=1 Tax=Couchioplanes caeruleus TaxID=56438 RepID=UPI0019BDBF80|nr:hypothetical protein [Couchioplanes caeruleus]GGQ79202.1 hypothetical protein GCM10010166_56420 [Couchioplanes caeruleus subsp. azureus]
MFGRLVSATGVLAAMMVLGAGLAPAAHAAPPPLREESPAAAPKASAKPTSLEISGTDANKIVIQQADRPELFQRVLGEVNWLSGAEPTTNKPKADKLGPKYTITVLAGEKATQLYDLYPLASGGPRAFRPEKQPAGRKSAGWFYGRLTMSESLRVSGVPLKEKPDVVSGGIGGGIGEKVDSTELDPVAVGSDVFSQMRRLFLINVAVLLVVLAGLGGVAFLIRRRV